MKLALLVANRGFFPSTVISSAREEMTAAFKRAGVEPIYPNLSATRHGAVETTAEGMVFADFLDAHRGNYDGLAICLPNFGDENGIKAAIARCDVPILLQAYPDQLNEMDFEHRRDAFCSKLTLTLPACAVLSVRKKAGKLQLVSTSRHITQGAADLLDVQYASGVLSGRSKVVKDDPYTIKAYDPKADRLVEKTILPTATGELEWTLD